jgi:hypothetical protein
VTYLRLAASGYRQIESETQPGTYLDWEKGINMRPSLRNSMLLLSVALLLLGVGATSALARVADGTYTGNLTPRTQAVFDAGIIRIRCDTHTVRVTMAGDSGSISAANNRYSDTTQAATSCPTDRAGTIVTVRVRCAWTLTVVSSRAPTTASGNIRIDADGCVDVAIERDFNCIVRIQRQSVPITLTSSGGASRLSTDNPNRIAIRGDRFPCTFASPPTQNETLTISPFVRIS